MHPIRALLVLVVSTVAVGTFTTPAAARVDGHHDDGVITYTVEPDVGAPAVVVARPDGSGRHEVEWPVGGAIVSRIAPDGRRLVAATFGDGEDFGTVRPGVSRLDGSDFHRLRVASVTVNADVGPCTWAGPHALLCEVRSGAGVVDGVYRVDPADRRPAVRLTTTPYPPGPGFGGGDIPGDVSPDGRQFVFMRSIPVAPPGHPEASQSGALFVGDLDGTHARRITGWGVPNSHDSGFASWSPDGRHIVFGTESGTLATIEPDGRGLHGLAINLPPDAYAYAPTWAPTSDRVAFGLFPGGNQPSDVYTADLRTGRIRQLTDTPAFDDAPDWWAPC